MRVFILFLTLTFAISSFAQNQINLNFNHKLNSSTFAHGIVGTSALGYTFEVDRLEYYMSEFKIIHDGGAETPVNDLYVLMDPVQISSVDLGVHNITNVEGVKFSIGVDSAHNHLDPSTYPGNHALAPKSPSMHWGWASGYRFVAMEGSSGDNNALIYELHALGDANYHEVNVVLSPYQSGNTIDLYVDAQYDEALSNIDVSNGAIVHSETDMETVRLLQNFQTKVFKTGSPTSTGIYSNYFNGTFNILSNVLTDGTPIKINYDLEGDRYVFRMVSMNGTEVYSDLLSDGIGVLKIDNNYSSGTYLVHLEKEGQIVASRKLIIQ